MQSVINTVKGTALGVAEYLTPVLKESKFRDTGVITPEEFVIAGDHLVHHCPTWQWASGDDDRIKPYLPANRQFLVTHKVPCSQRYRQIERGCDKEEVIEPDEDGGWVTTAQFDNVVRDIEDKVLDMKLDTEEENSDLKTVTVCNRSPVNRKITSNIHNEYQNVTVDKNSENSDNETSGDEDEEPLDMEEYEKSGLLETTKEPIANNDKIEDNHDKIGEGEIIKTRTYDLHITYDKYYQTPRLWIFGYDENHEPLSVEEIYDDISQDHAKKTVTMENHPNIPGPPMASVHPCRHAEVMKKLINVVCEGGGELGVHMYLIIFLKFVQSVIPTIDYDFTRNATLQ